MNKTCCLILLKPLYERNYVLCFLCFFVCEPLRGGKGKHFLVQQLSEQLGQQVRNTLHCGIKPLPKKKRTKRKPSLQSSGIAKRDLLMARDKKLTEAVECFSRKVWQVIIKTPCTYFEKHPKGFEFGQELLIWMRMSHNWSKGCARDFRICQWFISWSVVYASGRPVSWGSLSHVCCWRIRYSRWLWWNPSCIPVTMTILSFGAKLLALKKSEARLQPIAVGETLWRVCAKGFSKNWHPWSRNKYSVESEWAFCLRSLEQKELQLEPGVVQSWQGKCLDFDQPRGLR